jgi:hypothetical protein
MGRLALAETGFSPGLEPNVYRRCNVTTRRLAAALIAAGMALAVSGCSPGADYPSLFPAVHDMPPPRNDTTMNPLQVQQATEDLISERNHLSAGTQAPQQAGQAANPPVTAKAKPAAIQAAAHTSGNSQTTTPAPAQTAGGETK